MMRPEKLVVSLAIKSPGTIETETVGAKVETPLFKDKYAAFVRENQRKHHCTECGKPIEVLRRHFWPGIPRHHHKCWAGTLAARRNKRTHGLLTGGLRSPGCWGWVTQRSGGGGSRGSCRNRRSGNGGRTCGTRHRLSRLPSRLYPPGLKNGQVALGYRNRFGATSISLPRTGDCLRSPNSPRHPIAQHFSWSTNAEVSLEALSVISRLADSAHATRAHPPRRMGVDSSRTRIYCTILLDGKWMS
jgi:hypothetical protein